MRLHASCLVIFLAFQAASAQPVVPAPSEPAQPSAGSFILAGGGAVPPAVHDAFLKLAGGAKANVVVIAGSDLDPKNADKLLEIWKKRDIASANLLRAVSREQADSAAFVKSLSEATGVWLIGNDPVRLAALYRGRAVEAELKKVLERGGVIGGTAAGAAVMGRLVISSAKIPSRIEEAFGLLPHAVVDSQFLKRDRLDLLLDELARNPGRFGLGIDEQTAVILQGRTLHVVGSSYVVACLAAGAGRPSSCQVLKEGDKADLIALSRAAIARTQPPHPPVKPPIPIVVKGSLIIGGGGFLADDVWKKFIELAGGPKASIVVIPTALDFPLKGEPSESIRLKKAGAEKVQILHAASRAEAEVPAFLKVIDEAGGVWFSGGRQWRFVDAYLDTAADKAFHGVLARGGVIGGSSAGASIQADYMVRGDPLGNLKMMAEGYERGLGFLKGVAIDQHFFKRKRPPDMTDLLARHPQLLGIGIDEGAALLVRGETMEVLGKSTVAVYDRSRPVNGSIDYEVLQPGSRYNLRTRTKAEK